MEKQLVSPVRVYSLNTHRMSEYNVNDRMKLKESMKRYAKKGYKVNGIKFSRHTGYYFIDIGMTEN